ncbi:hypothetical protein L1887_53983 [Cichorium endivia]|nr:hypothetical protein L1887_53983 [Cichorium endivia]
MSSALLRSLSSDTRARWRGQDDVDKRLWGVLIQAMQRYDVDTELACDLEEVKTHAVVWWNYAGWEPGNVAERTELVSLARAPTLVCETARCLGAFALELGLVGGKGGVAHLLDLRTLVLLGQTVLSAELEAAVRALAYEVDGCILALRLGTRTVLAALLGTATQLRGCACERTIAFAKDADRVKLGVGERMGMVVGRACTGCKRLRRGVREWMRESEREAVCVLCTCVICRLTQAAIRAKLGCPKRRGAKAGRDAAARVTGSTAHSSAMRLALSPLNHCISNLDFHRWRARCASTAAGGGGDCDSK